MKEKKYVQMLAFGGLAVVILAAAVVYGVRHGMPSAVKPKAVAEAEPVTVPAFPEGEDVRILLEQDGSSVKGEGAEVSGNRVLINQGGTYLVSGALEDGQIYVDAGSDDVVFLVFSGVDIRNTAEAAVYVENAGHTAIVLEEGTDNRLQSGKSADFHASDDNAGGAALYSRDNLSISGTGSVQVYGYINNGIHTTNHLLVEGGNFSVEARNNGVKGKDSVRITGGNFTILSGGDGIKSEDTSGEGYGTVTITGGTFSIDSSSDAIHSNENILISGGIFQISTGDDGIHADKELTVEDGSIQIAKSYEGLEANQVLINGGEISIAASDDGINACGGQSKWGQDSSGKTTEEVPDLRITGGNIYINADGDGMDSNGNITIEGGDVVVDGPSDGWNGAIDSGSENGGICTISGGTVIAVGSSDMAETFDEGSAQYSFRHNFDSSFEAGDEITVKDGKGNVLFSHTASKTGNSVVFSCPELKPGENYILDAGHQSAEILLDSVSTVSGRKDSS